jgi:hypothetical protein
MTTRLAKKIVLLGISVTFVLTTIPALVTAGDSPEPGPPGSDVKYTYVAPPFIGDEMHLKLDDDSGDLYLVDGTACQVGNRECCLKFTNYIVADYSELVGQGLDNISCADLKSKYFHGEYTEVPILGEVDFVGDCTEYESAVEGVDFIAVGKIRCFEDEYGKAKEGYARIILMGWAPKTK